MVMTLTLTSEELQRRTLSILQLVFSREPRQKQHQKHPLPHLPPPSPVYAPPGSPG